MQPIYTNLRFRPLLRGVLSPTFLPTQLPLPTPASIEYILQGDQVYMAMFFWYLVKNDVFSVRV